MKSFAEIREMALARLGSEARPTLAAASPAAFNSS